MPIKSTASRYGAIAILLHWLMAMLLAALIVTGFQAASAADESTKAARLMLHAPLGLNLLLLLVLRILWRTLFDRKPAAHTGGARWQRGAGGAFGALSGLAHGGGIGAGDVYPLGDGADPV